MRACVCGGTGFELVPRGDYRMPDGSVKKDVPFARRCPGYEDYFAASALMRDYPEKVPVRKEHGLCKAALAAHSAIYRSNQERRRDDKAL